MFGLIVADAFTFIPGRLMWRVFYGKSLFYTGLAGQAATYERMVPGAKLTAALGKSLPQFDCVSIWTILIMGFAFLGANRG